eukprot:c20983_g1_i1.p1 GENE.c20983_g1_i1~~c20983_g1_i1.p1  ORF type:complete len:1409 (+),score=622.08 c20983_g1_i1:55-4281(+)
MSYLFLFPLLLITCFHFITISSYQLTIDATQYAEETISDGNVYTESGDLKLTHESGDEQIVGLRFSRVRIPRNSQIKSAYIQFAVDEISTGPLTLDITAEKVSDPNIFENGFFLLSSRDKTSNVVTWQPEPWLNLQEMGPAQRTSNISSVIQEIVDMPTWYFGKTMVILISRNPSDTSTNTRIAESGWSGLTPQLIVEFDSVCKDDNEFTDEQGYYCADWSAFNCFAAQINFGYSSTGISNLITSCGFSCNACPDPPRTVSYINTTDGIFYPTAISLYARKFSEQSINTQISHITGPSLKIGNDGTSETIIALRFLSLNIPRNTKIESAFIQFETYASSEGYVIFEIFAEHSSSPTKFSANNLGDLSSTNRIRTTASSAWLPGDWNITEGITVNQTTTELNTIIQEIVSMDNWQSGNDIVIIIQRHSRDVTTNFRIAKSGGDGGPGPILYVKYLSQPVSVSTIVESVYFTSEAFDTRKSNTSLLELSLFNSEGITQAVALHFDVQMPRDSIVSAASIQFAVSYPSTENITIRIRAEADINDMTLFDESDFDVSSRPYTVAQEFWNPGPWLNQLDSGDDQKTVDFSSVMNEISTKQAWYAGIGALIVLHEGDGADLPQARFAASPLTYYPPSIHLEYKTAPCVDNALFFDEFGYSCSQRYGVTCADSQIMVGMSTNGVGDLIANCPLTCGACYAFSSTPTPTVTPDPFQLFSPSDTTTSTISTRSWSKEQYSGTSSTTTTTLEFFRNAGYEQTVGIRFDGVRVPPNSIVTNAYIQFTTSELGYGEVIIRIRAESSIFPVPFITTNSYDLTNRLTTNAQVDWSPPPWLVKSESGSAQQTPNLRSLVQEIVVLQGWTSPRSMVFLFDKSPLDHGQSTRVAATSGTGAPKLVITYLSGVTTFTSTYSSRSSSEENIDSGNVSLNPSEIDFTYKDGEQIIGVEYANLDLPSNIIVAHSHIKFTSNQPSAGPFSDNTTDLTVRIFTENSTSTSSSLTSDLSDLSKRSFSKSYLDWNIKEWKEAAQQTISQQTGDLSLLVQQSVQQTGWISNNSLVFLIQRSPLDLTFESRVAQTTSSLFVLYAIAPTPSQTPSISETPTISTSSSETPTISLSSSETPSISLSSSITSSNSLTSSNSPSISLSSTQTPSASKTAATSPTTTSTVTSTSTTSSSVTPSNTPSPSSSATSSLTVGVSPSITSSSTSAASETATISLTPTSSVSSSISSSTTPTSTNSPTISSSPSLSSSRSPSTSRSPSFSASSSVSTTRSPSRSSSKSLSRTPSSTSSASISASPSSTLSISISSSLSSSPPPSDSNSPSPSVSISSSAGATTSPTNNNSGGGDSSSGSVVIGAAVGGAGGAFALIVIYYCWVRAKKNRWRAQSTVITNREVVPRSKIDIEMPEKSSKQDLPTII